MKIKVWALVLVIIGSLFVGAAGMFVGMSGVALVGKVLQNAQLLVPRVSIEAPGVGGNNGNYGNGNGGYFGNGGNDGGNFGGGMMPGRGGYSIQVPADNTPALPANLPAGFNAGVNIESTYAAMTNRSVEQLQAAEQSAGTDAWGLAKKEGKLDELKAKVTDAVTASLKQMVSDKKITQEQSDSYLDWVKQYLQTVGQANNGVMIPGGRGGWQIVPDASAAPGSQS